MAQAAKKLEQAVSTLIRRVETLDDEALWMFVCRLFPEANEEFLEDAFDIITLARAKLEPVRPLNDVLKELDKQHAVPR